MMTHSPRQADCAVPWEHCQSNGLDMDFAGNFESWLSRGMQPCATLPHNPDIDMYRHAYPLYGAAAPHQRLLTLPGPTLRFWQGMRTMQTMALGTNLHNTQVLRQRWALRSPGGALATRPFVLGPAPQTKLVKRTCVLPGFPFQRAPDASANGACSGSAAV